MSQHVLYVANIKCGGCGKHITDELNKLGFKDVVVHPDKNSVIFEGEDVEVARRKLTDMGYPLAGTPEAKKFSKKAHSYVSCAIGRLS